MSSSDIPEKVPIPLDMDTGKIEQTNMTSDSDSPDEVPYRNIGKTKCTMKKEGSSNSSDSSGEDIILPDMRTGKLVKEASSKAHRAVIDEVDGNDTFSDSDSDLSDSDYVCILCSKKFSGYIPLKQHEKGKNHLKAILKKEKEKKLLEKITNAEKMTDNDEDELVFKKPYAICKICHKEFGGPETYYDHIISKAHKKKVHQSSVLDQVRDEGEIDVEKLKDHLEGIQSRITSLLPNDEDTVDIEEFECKECDKSFTGLIPYAQHLTSKIHAKKVESKKLVRELTPGDADDIHKSTNSSDRGIITLVNEDGILVCKLCSTSFSGPGNAVMHMKSRGHSKNFEKRKRKQEKKGAAAAIKDDSESGDESDSPDEIQQVEMKKEARRRLDSSNIDSAGETLITSVSANEKRGDQMDSAVGGTFDEKNTRQKFTSSNKIADEEASVSQYSKVDGKSENIDEDTEKEVKGNESSYKAYKTYKELLNTLKTEDDDN